MKVYNVFVLGNYQYFRHPAEVGIQETTEERRFVKFVGGRDLEEALKNLAQEELVLDLGNEVVFESQTRYRVIPGDQAVTITGEHDADPQKLTLETITSISPDCLFYFAQQYIKNRMEISDN